MPLSQGEQTLAESLAHDARVLNEPLSLVHLQIGNPGSAA